MKNTENTKPNAENNASGIVRKMGADLSATADEAAFPKWLMDFIKKGPFNDLDPDIKEPKFRFSMNDVPIAPAGEMIAVSGKPGVGKTTIISIIVGILMKGKSWGGLRCITPAKRCLWIDSEKGDFSCKRKTGYMRKVAGIGSARTLEEEGVDMWLIRDYSTDQRFQLVRALAKLKKYDLVILDGVIDLMAMKDTNDTTETTDLLQSLTRDGANVVAMLHSNKAKEDDNMRYAIGTELWRLATTWLLVSYDEESKKHCLELKKSNDTSPADPIYFTYDENGMPEPVTIDMREAFKQLFADGKEREWKKMRKELASKNGIKDDEAFNLCRRAQEDKTIIKNESGNFVLNPMI